MGMKGAAPYFQQFIAVTVLAGLIYHVAEAYIDDVSKIHFESDIF